MNRDQACKAKYDADCAKYWKAIEKDGSTAKEAFRVGYARGVMFATLTMAEAMSKDLKASFEERANLT